MTKLCARGKSAAKRKFRVYPSAYANAYASKICAGKIKDPSGVKRKDFKGPKPAGAKTGVMVEKDQGKKRQKNQNVIDKIQQQRKTKQQRLEDLKKELGMNKGGVKSKKQVDPRHGLEFRKGKPKKGTSDHLGNPVVVRSAKVGKLMTAGAQSGLGRLQKSGLIKAKKGKAIAIMIAVGKPKKANEGVFIKKPVPSPMAREKTSRPTAAKMKYQRELQEYYDATGKKPRPRRTKKMNTGGSAIKIKKIIKGLNKASKTHAAQAKTLKTIKVRGGGIAMQGMNFKGVY